MDHHVLNKRAYDCVAPVYEAARREWTLDDEMRRFHASIPDGAILDAGCGPGRDLVGLQAAGHRVVGLDASRSMLGHASSQTSLVVNADLRALPIAPSSLVGIWCTAVLPHFAAPEWPTVLGLFRRSLRIGGKLMSAVKVGEFEGYEAAQDLAGVDRWVRYVTVDEAVRLLEEAGLRVIWTSCWNEAERFPGGRDMEFLSTLAVAVDHVDPQRGM